MKVYVAGKYEEKEAVRYVQKQLHNMGHTITHDWTGEDLGDRTGVVAASYLRMCAEKDVKGVENADAVVLLNHKNGFGLMCEMGIAIAHKIPVFIIDAKLRDTVFFYLPGVYCVDKLSEVFAILEDGEAL